MIKDVKQKEICFCRSSLLNVFKSIAIFMMVEKLRFKNIVIVFKKAEENFRRKPPPTFQSFYHERPFNCNLLKALFWLQKQPHYLQ